MELRLSTVFFILSTLSILPFYLLMLFMPRAAVTRRVLGSLWPVELPSAVHGSFILCISIWLKPDVLGLWRGLYLENGLFGTTTVAFLSKVYDMYPAYATLHGWVHVVVGDLFMARWAYLDGVEQNAPGWMLALISLMIGFVGPLGVITYVLIRPRFAQAKQK